jgi:hypothetical protein
MSGRKSKNSSVTGFVVVQSGSGSFFALSARVTKFDDTLSQSSSKTKNIDREEDTDMNMLEGVAGVNDRCVA